MPLLQIVIGLLVLGLLVLIHELGHFVTAKLFGVRVISFSIGFGKPLLTRTFGGTEYRISAIPFGGFVHMAGEHPEDEQEQKPDEFNAKPIWQRALIALAGPTANYASAVAFLWLAFVIGVPTPRYLNNTVVGGISDSTAAAMTAIQPGDTILAIDGQAVGSWQDIENAFSRLEQSYRLDVARNGERLSVTMGGITQNNGNGEMQIHPTAGLLPAPPPVIGDINDDSPAGEAGLQPGDSVVAVNGEPIAYWPQLSDRVSDYDTAAGSVQLTVVRDGERRIVDVTPAYDERVGRYLIGINLAEQPTLVRRYGVFEAVPRAFGRSVDIVVLVYNTVKQLFTRRIPPDQLAGPLGIVQMSGGVAFMGVVPILRFMALIGINLALLNLLPLVITDGGLLLFMGIEAVRGKPLPLRYQLVINRIAIAFFIVLFMYVTFNDILRIPKLFNLGP
ncbi:MAG: RIP metalloprotease RseP [Chitinivibrionales bacterium]|nr:RIP metalloprotease RseP [Chitinivibrionales bacterium]